MREALVLTYDVKISESLSDVVTIRVESGAVPDGNEDFAEFMKITLEDWYELGEGAVTLRKE